MDVHEDIVARVWVRYAQTACLCWTGNNFFLLYRPCETVKNLYYGCHCFGGRYWSVWTWSGQGSAKQRTDCQGRCERSEQNYHWKPQFGSKCWYEVVDWLNCTCRCYDKYSSSCIGNWIELFQVKTANIFDKDSLLPVFEGCDAVLSCLGSHSYGFSRVTLYSDTIVSISEAMRSAKVKKLVVMSAAMCKGRWRHVNLCGDCSKL